MNKVEEKKVELSRIKASEVAAKCNDGFIRNPATVKENENAFIEEVNAWKMNPLGKKKVFCRVQNATFESRNSPERSFFDTLADVLREDGFVCSFVGVNEGWFDVALPTAAPVPSSAEAPKTWLSCKCMATGWPCICKTPRPVNVPSFDQDRQRLPDPADKVCLDRRTPCAQDPIVSIEKKEKSHADEKLNCYVKMEGDRILFLTDPHVKCDTSDDDTSSSSDDDDEHTVSYAALQAAKDKLRCAESMTVDLIGKLTDEEHVAAATRVFNQIRETEDMLNDL